MSRPELFQPSANDVFLKNAREGNLDAIASANMTEITLKTIHAAFLLLSDRYLDWQTKRDADVARSPYNVIGALSRKISKLEEHQQLESTNPKQAAEKRCNGIASWGMR